MRILALDWGEVRIGAAVSDPSGKIAFALEKVIDSKRAVDEIKKIIAETNTESIVLGLPKNLASEEGKSARKLKLFADKLFASVGIPIILVDERFSTVQADKLLKSQGLSEKQQRPIKDNIAAQVMLQQYLDSRNKE